MICNGEFDQTYSIFIVKICKKHLKKEQNRNWEFENNNNNNNKKKCSLETPRLVQIFYQDINILGIKMRFNLNLNARVYMMNCCVKII